MTNKKLSWSAKYELGIEDIDFQHHFFLDLINRLSNALNEPRNHSYQARLISELNAYARFHFISEENMMLHTDYPQFSEHKNHHDDLLEQLSIRENMLDMKHSEEEIAGILKFLSEWFFHHTVSEDRLFSEYLKEKYGKLHSFNL
ncbi:MAG: bacteriohemerythrin [Candidatus Sedimenticola sp. 20ELBAFRAG]